MNVMVGLADGVPLKGYSSRINGVRIPETGAWTDFGPLRSLEKTMPEQTGPIDPRRGLW